MKGFGSWTFHIETVGLINKPPGTIRQLGVFPPRQELEDWGAWKLLIYYRKMKREDEYEVNPWRRQEGGRIYEETKN